MSRLADQLWERFEVHAVQCHRCGRAVKEVLPAEFLCAKGRAIFDKWNQAEGR